MSRATETRFPPEKREKASLSGFEVAGADVAGPVRQVNGPEVDAMNSLEQPRRVDVRESHATARSGGLDSVCPAHSITILRLAAR